MELGNSPQQILHHLKMRGPQSVRLLARRLTMTTMGVRQHLADLAKRELVSRTDQTRQRRGRPLHLWQLTEQGHARFADHHAEVSVELIEVMEQQLGPEALENLILARNESLLREYERALAKSDTSLAGRVKALADLRSAEGYMAEVRLLPDGFLLIENHCPIRTAASRCSHFCAAELALFRQLLEPRASVSRGDYLLAGARRCAYHISPRQPD